METTSEIGSLVLKGWTMMAESCPSCKVPYMKCPADQSILCVSCHETLDDPTSFTEHRWNDTVRDERLGPFAAHRTDSGESGLPYGDSVSDALAQKMARGYTLLNHSCPRCNTPLVSKGGNALRLCVNCRSSFLPTDSQSKRQLNDLGLESSQTSNKMMKAASLETAYSEPQEKKPWTERTQNVLIQTVSRLTSDLNCGTSITRMQETTSLMNSCMDALLKLKEFTKS